MKPSFNEIRDRLYDVAEIETVRETVFENGVASTKTSTQIVNKQKPAWVMLDENANNFLWWCLKTDNRFTNGDIVQFSWRSIQEDLGRANFNSLKDALELLKKYGFINYGVDKKGFTVQKLWS